MSSVNTVILIGRVGQDPDLKELTNGRVVNFSLATNDRWTDKNGEKQERTTWHRITAWGKLAEICAKYLSKGSLCYVEGKIQERSWEQDGEKRSVMEIVANNVQFLESKSEGKPAVKNYAPQTSGDEIPW